MFNKQEKILFAINGLNVGGAQRLVVDQINYLSQKGYQVYLITTVKSKVLNFFPHLKIQSDNIYIIDYYKLGFIKSILKLRKIIKMGGFNLIISHLYLTNTLIRFACIFLVKKPIILIYEHNAYYKEKTFKNLLIDKVLARFSDKIIAVSEYVKYFLLESGIPENKIRVIENGIDFKETNVDRSNKRRELGINDGDVLFVSVGNVDEQKGYDILISAAEKLTKERNNLYFMICGTCHNLLFDRLKQLVLEKKIEDKVIFLGPRSDVIEILKAADYFLMPSRWEGLSIALLEALNLSKAVIVSDIDGMKNIIIDRENGIKFISCDADDLVKKVNELLGNNNLKIKIEKNAFICASNYTISNNIQKILHVYYECKNNRKKKIKILINKLKSEKYNLNNQKSSKWVGRSRIAINFINKISLNKEILKIADLGCGDQKIKNLLEEIGYRNIIYRGFDIEPQSDDVKKIDLDKEEIIGEYDVVFCMGLIEYLSNIKIFLSSVRLKTKYIILSYVVADKHNYTKDEIKFKGWKNHLYSKELERIFSELEITIKECVVADNGLTKIYLLKV